MYKCTWLAVLALFLGGCMGGELTERPPMAADAEGRVLVDDFQDNEPGPYRPEDWRKQAFSDKHAHTSYGVAQEDGNHFLQARARNAASSVMHPVSLDLEKTPVLTWRWRVSKVPEGANIRHKKTEDTAARVVVMFDYDPGRLGLAMRTAYTIAASRADGEYPPLFTLAYVWAADAEPGDIITSTYTDRIKFIVLQSGNAKAGQWVSERRHVLKDFHAAFGDQEPTPIEGLGVMTDTDDLKDDVTASYDDFMFLPAGPGDTPAR